MSDVVLQRLAIRCVLASVLAPILGCSGDGEAIDGGSTTTSGPQSSATTDASTSNEAGASESTGPAADTTTGGTTTTEGTGTGESGGTECMPMPHDTQGPERNHEIQRYRFVGGAGDGRKVAVLFSHFGPSSQSPFANLFGYEAGVATPLFHHLTFLPELGTEESLAQVEAQVLADAADDLATHGIIEGENLPVSQAFCQEGPSVHVAPEDTCTWELADQPCPGGVTDPIAQWELCCGPGRACVGPVVVPESDCFEDGELSLLDVFVAGDVWWVVAERVTHPFEDLSFVMRSVGGLLQTP